MDVSIDKNRIIFPAWNPGSNGSTKPIVTEIT
jgi:hypothetical protein